MEKERKREEKGKGGKTKNAKNIKNLIVCPVSSILLGKDNISKNGETVVQKRSFSNIQEKFGAKSGLYLSINIIHPFNYTLFSIVFHLNGNRIKS